MNVEVLGNQISHLHWHIIPRYENDRRWGEPIWTTTKEEMEIINLPNNEYRELVEEIRAKFI